MYSGEYNHTIDSKGRLIVPSKFREALGECFMITKGVDHCLTIYDKEEWSEFVAKLRTLPGGEQTRKMVRFISAGAVEAEIDKQGRILIPGELRKWAGLEKDVVLAGVLNRIEVWDKAAWEETNTFDDMNEIAEHMAEFGLGI